MSGNGSSILTCSSLRSFFHLSVSSLILCECMSEGERTDVAVGTVRLSHVLVWHIVL